MKLHSINIEGFRGFSKIQIDGFSDLNLIVGKNNSGKTSVLEAIFLAIGISNPHLTLTIDTIRGLYHDDVKDFQFIFHNFDVNTEIQIDSEFKSLTQFRKLRIHPVFLSANNMDSKAIGVSSNTRELEKKLNGVEFRFSVKSLKQSKDKFHKAILEYNSKGIKSTQPETYKETLFGTFLRSTTSLNDIYEKLDNILVKKNEERLIHSLNHIDKRISGISLGAKNMIYFDIGINQLVPVQIMGDGIVRLLSYMVNIANSENGVLLIDEIENGFHYSVLPNLWQSIYESAKLYNVQLFATTHSYECAKAFSGIQDLIPKEDDPLRLFRIDNTPNGYDVVKYDSEVLDASFDSNWEIR
ncbi:MAG: AAA family ATPase [Bacteroidales bacterium]|nr:AAA family ATPase [Bacteroidales bacterium]MCF8458423.1 AAA family ATPase [Bacteroidales bacterium]